jgi:hypothetical protein
MCNNSPRRKSQHSDIIALSPPLRRWRCAALLNAVLSR